MAYVEIKKSGRLVARRVVDDAQARKGCRIRLGAAGRVVLALGQTRQVGSYELAMCEGLPADDGYEAVAGLREVSGSFPSMSQTAEAPYAGPAGTQQADQTPPLPVIEDYKITDRLGEGGMGTVWRAVQLSTKREVAMKFLGGHRFASKRSRARFEREVALAAKLTHPNIARVYDSGLHRGVYYYAMELIDGVHLDTFVQQNELSREEILGLMRDVCDAVHHAHTLGIVHRDLKPSNILITPDGRPHIVDFGLAKASMQEQDDVTISIEGEVSGTLAYMSPEQAAGRGDKISERTDVYSLGVILFELLVGRLPHDMSGSRYDVIKRIVEQEVQSPRRDSDAIDGDLEALILTALARKPEDRYPSAGVLRQDIENYLHGDALYARSLSTTYRIRKHLGKYRRPMTVALAYGSVLAVVVVAALYLVHVERKRRIEAEQARQISEGEIARLLGQQERATDGTARVNNGQQQRPLVAGAEREPSTVGKRPRVLFDETHRQHFGPDVPGALKALKDESGDHYDPNQIEMTLCDILIDKLRKEYIVSSNTTLPLLRDTLQEADVLFLVPCRGDISYAERIAMRDYIEQGGNLLILGVCSWWEANEASNANLYHLLTDFGLKVHLPWVRSLDNTLWDSGAFIVDLTRIHPATSHATRLQLEFGHRVETISPFAQIIETTGNLRVWEDVNTNGIKDADEPLRSNVGIIGVSEYGKGRVVYIATHMIANDRADSPTHDVVLSVMKWLTADANQVVSVGRRTNQTGAATKRIVYVDADAIGANNGTRWADAYRCLQDALAAAVQGDEIRVAQGTYRPDRNVHNPGGSGDRAAAFGLRNGVVVGGGYAGFGEPDPDAQDSERYRTILSGDLSGNDVGDLSDSSRAENSYHVVTGSDTGETAVLDGFTVTGGNADGPFPHDGGGGMYNSHGHPVVVNCTFVRNSGTQVGGGMSNLGSSPRLTRCTFVDNLALSGSGMCNAEGSNTILIDCTFNRNSCKGDGTGAGMFNGENCSPTLTNCTFIENASESNGGGMYNYHCDPKLLHCTFNGNSAGQLGGGINNDQSSPTLDACVFSRNSSTNGGGMYNWRSSPSLANCAFAGNSSTHGGAGIYNNSDCSPILTNCSFENNSALFGGGMYNRESAPTLTGCTFSGNTTDRGGGAMSNFSQSRPILAKCIFTGNSSHIGGAVENQETSRPVIMSCLFRDNRASGSGGGMANHGGSSPTVSSCLFIDNEAGDSGSAIDNFNSSPLIVNCTFSGNSSLGGAGAFSAAGGGHATLRNCILWRNDRPIVVDSQSTTVTVAYSNVQTVDQTIWPGTGNINMNPLFVSPAAGDYHLQFGSPCVDAGDPNTTVAPDEIDMDGQPRVGGSRIDMGADEFADSHSGTFTSR